jgi:hypothetical protein
MRGAAARSRHIELGGAEPGSSANTGSRRELERRRVRRGSPFAAGGERMADEVTGIPEAS